MILLVLVIFTAGSSLPNALAQGNNDGGLFSTTTPTADMQAQSLPDHVARARFVTVNLNLLQQADTQNQALTLNLFDDTVYTGVVNKVEKVTGDSVSRYGSLLNVENGYFYLVTAGDAFMAHVASPAGIYEVKFAGNGVYRVEEIDQSKFVDHAPNAEASYLPSGDVLPDGSLGVEADAAKPIDVMAIYTDDVLTSMGGSVSAVKAMINLAVAETNKSYANAGVTTRLRLVHTAEVNYVETGNIFTDLPRFRNKGDGYFDQVHTWRNWFGADMVSLIIHKGGSYCGLASTIMANAATAFQVTDDDCATGYYSFGHEFGHLQGARHDMYVDSDITPYTYGHGYVYVPGKWRTVMAYNTKCADSGTNCTRLQWWSNPNRLNSGIPMGNTNSKNFRVLNNTAYTVANFRQKVLTPKKLFIPSGSTTDRTPKFQWSKVPGATHYRIQVWRGTTKVYTKTYTYACATAKCQRSPAKVLGFRYFKFRVKAKVKGVWQPWSAFKKFSVIPISFTTDFDTTHPKWNVINGSWSHRLGKFYSSPGLSGNYVTISRKDDYKDGTYSVRMKRNGCETCENIIMIRGVENPLSTNGRWKNAYVFAYNNNGRFEIYKASGGTISGLVPWTNSSAVHASGTTTGQWNVLKVAFTGTQMNLFINNTLVATVYDGSFKKGNLGIGFKRDTTTTGNRIYVDWASLTDGLADMLQGDTLSGLSYNSLSLNENVTQFVDAP